MRIARVVPVVLLAVIGGCDARPDWPAIGTLEAGVVKIAVTSTTVTDALDPEEWMYRYAKHLGHDLGLRVDWHVVPFDKSWELAGQDVVDVVATNLASFPDRVSPGGTFSAPFLYEQRALRIRAADRSQYRTIADFAGKKVGAVKGMAAQRDLLRRAPSGVQIVSATTFPELYKKFESGQLDAIAQAEYFTLDGRIIPSVRAGHRADRPPRLESRPARGIGVRRARQELAPPRSGQCLRGADTVSAAPPALG